jgi:hypothetical protein
VNHTNSVAVLPTGGKHAAPLPRGSPDLDLSLLIVHP